MEKRHWGRGIFKNPPSPMISRRTGSGRSGSSLSLIHISLAIIAAREEQIRSFKPEDYYGLTCLAGGVKWTWRHKKSGSTRSFQKDFITSLRQDLQGKSLTVTDVHKSAKKTYSPGLYDLTELQRDANQKFGYSAKETLNIMQRL